MGAGHPSHCLCPIPRPSRIIRRIYLIFTSPTEENRGIEPQRLPTPHSFQDCLPTIERCIPIVGTRTCLSLLLYYYTTTWYSCQVFLYSFKAVATKEFYVVFSSDGPASSTEVDTVVSSSDVPRCVAALTERTRWIVSRVSEG